jgi:hypothetical protein
VARIQGGIGQISRYPTCRGVIAREIKAVASVQHIRADTPFEKIAAAISIQSIIAIRVPRRFSIEMYVSRCASPVLFAALTKSATIG